MPLLQVGCANSPAGRQAGRQGGALIFMLLWQVGCPLLLQVACPVLCQVGCPLLWQVGCPLLAAGQGTQCGPGGSQHCWLVGRAPSVAQEGHSTAGW